MNNFSALMVCVLRHQDPCALSFWFIATFNDNVFILDETTTTMVVG